MRSPIATPGNSSWRPAARELRRVRRADAGGPAPAQIAAAFRRREDMQPPGEERGHTWLELLTAMAEELNYPQLKQTDLDKFYIPRGMLMKWSFKERLRNNGCASWRKRSGFWLSPAMGRANINLTSDCDPKSTC
jgi:hypothetical protein